MKKCIWCLCEDNEVKFSNRAHIVPQQLGGELICENVCDKCNSHFGNSTTSNPSVEAIIKEAFNLSRTFFLKSEGDVGKNKSMVKYSSVYFNLDLPNHKLSLKPRYKFHRHFQENVAMQLKRGIFKMYLEERERFLKDAHDQRFDFIREFSRYGIGDYPVYYFERTNGIIPMLKQWAQKPSLILDQELQPTYLITDYGFTEFEFLGHVFGLPISRHWDIAFFSYIRESMKKKEGMFKAYKQIKKFNDMDVTLSVMGDKK